MSLAFLFHYLMLNMFRMLIHPFSGACDLFVQLFHGLYCSGSMCVGVTLWFGWGGVVSVCRLRHSIYSTIKMMQDPINIRLSLLFILRRTRDRQLRFADKGKVLNVKVVGYIQWPRHFDILQQEFLIRSIENVNFRCSIPRIKEYYTLT